MQKLKQVKTGNWFVLAAAAALFTSGGALRADVKLPAVFGDHMVLQQGVPVPVWGKAAPGEAVTVTFAGQTKQTTAAADGRWLVRLDALKAAPDQAGQSMTIAGKNSLTLQDILVGETWICSGQSNMQMAVNGCQNATEEIATANFPQIRLFTVANRTALAPQDDCEGQWVVCTPDTVGGFSGVGYFFGRHLHQALKLPVGLINTSWGGTIAEAWTSAEALRKDLPEFIPAMESVAKPGESYEQAIVAYQQKMVGFKAAMEKFYVLEEDVATAAKFAAPDLDDAKWMTMNVPGNWEIRGMPDLDGIVWLRKTIDVPADWAGKDVMLRPGPIDEVEVTWFNGVQVGNRGRSRTRETQYWNQTREYRVPGKLVKAGKNVVAIRVSDTTGQGGLWGAPADTMYASLADGAEQTKVSLAGDWRAWAEFTLPKAPANPDTPNRPTVLFNAMINPLVPLALRGAIWYQGESNAGRAMQYRTLLPTMISDWRTRFGVGDFPFLIVQLANFMARAEQPMDSAWAELREAQTLTTTKLPKVAQALAIDIGDAKDIHPKNKQEVGRRLGLAAEALAYSRQVEYSGPVFKSMTVVNNRAELSFDHAGEGMMAKGDSLKGFAICGADRKFIWAQAQVAGDKVLVWAETIVQPVAVRYAWGDNPECSLYNAAGLPAVPFRTDAP